MCTIPKVSHLLYAVEIDIVCREIDEAPAETTNLEEKERKERDCKAFTTYVISAEQPLHPFVPTATRLANRKHGVERLTARFLSIYLDQVGDVHWHLLDLSVVEALEFT